MNEAAANIMIGVVSGVSSGLVLASFFGAKDLFRRRSERRKQIAYLSDLIFTFRRKIFGVEKDLYTKQSNIPIKRDDIRRAY